MTKQISMRGADPVGRIDDFAPVEAAAVLFLRLWHDSPDTQRRLREDFAGLLGLEAADHAVQALADIGSQCARRGRRPFLRHHPACRCVGADEACLANPVTPSLEGEREDAVLITTLLVRSDFSPQLVAAAPSLALSLRRLVLQAAPAVASARRATFH